MRASVCSGLLALLFIVTVSCDSYELSYTNSDGSYYYQPSERIRDKRTLGFLLKSFADAIGYDVQKRPSALPLGTKPAASPAAPAPAAAPVAPAVPAAAPAVPAAAPAVPAAAPAVPAAAPAASAGAPAAPAPAVPAPAPKAPAPPAPAAPAPAAPVPAAPAPAAPVPAAPVPAAPVPAAPAPASPAPAASAPAAPAPAPKAPAPAAPASAAPAPSPAAPAPAPRAPAAAPRAPAAAPRPPTAPPLLTETIQKMFNINFNWNRNVQPTPVAGAPKTPGAPAPAPSPNSPAPAPSPNSPAPAPAAPPAVPPKAPAPAAPPSAPAPAPAAPPSAPAPAAPPKAPVPAPAPAPAPAAPGNRAPPKKYHQATYQETDDYIDPQQIIYYPDYQEPVNQQQNNQVQDYDYPRVINAYWQNSPWNRKNSQYNVQNNAPAYQEYVTPDGETGYHVRQYQQNSHLQHQDVPENNNADSSAELQQEQIQENSAEQEQNQREQEHPQNEEEQQYQEQPQYQQLQSNPDVNVDSSQDYYRYHDNQPRGFQPVYHGSESRYQTGYFRPGLPLSVHGIQKDKVLIAWPSPFEPAETEIRKKIAAASRDRIQAAGSEQQEYKYEPESYSGFTFFEVPEPKSEYTNYKTPADPKIEDELSPNAKISETNYGKKYTNVRFDRNTQTH